MTSLTIHREKIICHNVADFTAIEGSCCCSGPLGITGVARVSLTPSGRTPWGVPRGEDGPWGLPTTALQRTRSPRCTVYCHHIISAGLAVCCCVKYLKNSCARGYSGFPPANPPVHLPANSPDSHTATYILPAHQPDGFPHSG